LVEETRGPGENHWPAASHWQTLLHRLLYWVHHNCRLIYKIYN
jgi:dipeptidyl aminopeptidase/acylaminoacyl peptidase